jgi:polyphosphate kinase
VRGLIDMSHLIDLDRPELKFDRWTGVTRRPFTAPDARTLFLWLRRTDALVQIPYGSSASSVEAFVGRAARDPQDPRSRRPETARHD